jgi:hypothetical protein
MRLPGYAWLAVGMALLLCLFQPNFHVGSQGITGWRVLGVAWQGDTPMEGVMQERNYFLMVAHTLGYALLGLGTVALGFLALLRPRPLWGWLAMACALPVMLVGCACGWSLDTAEGTLSVITKLLPRTSLAFWLAVALQFVIFASAGAALWLLSRSRPASAHSPESHA